MYIVVFLRKEDIKKSQLIDSLIEFCNLPKLDFRILEEKRPK